jgi:hypothetical protein
MVFNPRAARGLEVHQPDPARLTRAEHFTPASTKEV